MLIVPKDIPLKDLVEQRSLFLEKIENGEASSELIELVDCAHDLIVGRVDKAARWRAGLEDELKRATERLKYLKSLSEETDRLIEEATKVAPDKRLEGDTYVFRMQKSPPSFIVEDETVAPIKFRRMSLSLTDSEVSDERLLFWAGIVLERIVEIKKDLSDEERNSASPLYRLDVTKEERLALEQNIYFSLDKKSLKEAVKNKEFVSDKIRLESGEHLRVDTVKVKKDKK